MRVHCSAEIAVSLGAKPFGAKTNNLPAFLIVTPTGLFTLELLPGADTTRNPDFRLPRFPVRP